MGAQPHLRSPSAYGPAVPLDLVRASSVRMVEGCHGNGFIPEDADGLRTASGRRGQARACCTLRGDDRAVAVHGVHPRQTVPVIAVGDYNFDWNLPNGDTERRRTCVVHP